MPLRRKLAWVALLYFAQGLPFGFVFDSLPVYFRAHGVSLTDIGLLSLLGMPWTWKVLWAPLVDRFATPQTWIVGCLTAMGLLLYVLPFVSPAGVSTTLWVLLLAFTLASATQDIAIDAYTIGILAPGEEGAANGVRVSAYRVALIVAGGGALLLVTWLGWVGVFHAVAGVLLFLALIVWRSPRLPARGPAEESWLAGMRGFVTRPGFAALLAFVLLFKLGDASMGPMVRPFWLDHGLSVEEIGLVSNTLGVGLTIAGALLGGLCTTRWGLYRSLWSLGLLQAGSNLGYAAAAAVGGSRAAVYAASMLESFTGGLGTAAFLAFLMHVCDKRRAAVEYAFLSAVFGLTRSLAGAASGWATERLGYEAYFLATFVLALPAFALLPALRRWTR